MIKYSVPEHWEGTAAAHIVDPDSDATSNATKIAAILVALENAGILLKA